jgi:hypothetical protein
MDAQNKLRQQLIENADPNGKNKLSISSFMTKFNISKATYMRYNAGIKVDTTPETHRTKVFNISAE